MAIKKKPAVKEELPYVNNNGNESFKSIKELIYSFELGQYYNYKFTLGNKESQIAFNISELPHCCGISEIGNLGAKSNCDVKILSKFLDELVNNTPGHILMINTNGHNSSIIYENALAKCKNWELVREFENSNSGNTIKMWVSNNE